LGVSLFQCSTGGREFFALCWAWAWLRSVNYNNNNNFLIINTDGTVNNNNANNSGAVAHGFRPQGHKE